MVRRSELPQIARDLSDASLRLARAESDYLGLDLGRYLTLFKEKIIFSPDPRIYPVNLSLREEDYYRLLTLPNWSGKGFSSRIILTVLEEVNKWEESTLARKNKVQRNEMIAR